MHCPRWPVSRWASKSPPPAHPPARPVCASVSAPTRSFAKLEHFEQSISNHRPHDGVPRLIRDIRWWTRDRLHQVAATDQASPWGRGVRTGCWEGRGSQGSDPVRHGRKASVVCVGATVMIGRGEQTGCIGMYGGWAYDGWTYGDGRVAAGRVAMGVWRLGVWRWVHGDGRMRLGWAVMITDAAYAIWLVRCGTTAISIERTPTATVWRMQRPQIICAVWENTAGGRGCRLPPSIHSYR